MITGGDASPVSAVLRRIDAAADGGRDPESVPTGFPSVDRLLGGGLRRGDLVALGSDVRGGKSAFALAVALRAAAANWRTAFLTAEARPERIVERLLCIEGRAPLDEIRAGALDAALRASVGTAALRLRDLPLTIHALPPGGAATVMTVAPRIPPAALIVVDSLQALVSGGRTLDEELAGAARELKAAAMERDAVVLLVAQLPALDPTRADPRPRLADFGAVGGVAHHSDVVLALFREALYTAAPGTEGAAELHLLKNRSGATGYADLFFHTAHMRFEDVLDPEG